MKQNVYNRNYIALEKNYADNKINTLEVEANNLYLEAGKKLVPTCCLFMSKKSKYNEAYNLYVSAAEKYKMCNQWNKASDCYEKCAHIKMEIKESAFDSYKEAYSCSEKSGLGRNSDRLFAKMMNYLNNSKEYYEAGKLMEENGQKAENSQKYNEAITSYLKAIEFYEMDNNHNSLKNKCSLKVAELMVINNYYDAANKVPLLFENVGKEYLKDDLTKYSVDEYFGKAILSVIYYNKNLSEGSKYINKYKEMMPNFEDTPMCILCVNCVNAMENKDSSLMQKGINTYKETNKLDNFMTDIFSKLIIKVKKLGGGSS